MIRRNIFLTIFCAGCAAAFLTGCDSSYVKTEAHVIDVERQCKYTTHVNTQHDRMADCSNDPDFVRYRDARLAGSDVRVEGEAKISVSYYSPVDQQYREGHLKFDGDDDGFYIYRINDPVAIEVSKTDDAIIRPG